MTRARIICALITALGWGVVTLVPAAPGWAESDPAGDYLAIPDVIAGSSPDNLGRWEVRYERVAGGDPAVAASINEVIDAEARGQVATYEPSATKTHPWTFRATGTLSFLPLTVSELFVGEYNTDMPNMPFHAVATRVFDKRSGILITWDNLFLDKSAGLVRLAEQTQQILPATYAPPRQGWQFGNEVAPLDINFKYWIPTAEGIELHFPDYQFGRGLAVITVPWARVADLIAPEFAGITDSDAPPAG
ncbi:RsiV family protein [Mycolicibacter nonchromogenicus]|uniref:RsiV family protein n=1 Tax=Mycolicibacter nonchromogenicus TaxID=1782 RepID=UPI000ADC19B7|nr:RsiV family protein [Mycolicibacter nonchromogenicus]